MLERADRRPAQVGALGQFFLAQPYHQSDAPEQRSKRQDRLRTHHRSSSLDAGKEPSVVPGK
jgi:hypothetical protein